MGTKMDLKNILKKVKSYEKPASVLLGLAVVVVAGFLVFNFFQSRGKNQSLTEEYLPEEKTVSPANESENFSLPQVHEVREGDNLWKIAEEYYHSGYNWVDIAQENQLKNPNLLLVGEKITIPDVPARFPQEKIAGGQTSKRIEHYQVVRGDNLWKIAVQVYGDGYQWMKIYQANQDKIGPNPGLIFAGTVLVIP